jgi:prepilin-type N-terminal cleavage/methylation domain-containing protein
MRKGFTIIEVLVVIGIIAVLTVLIFPSISEIRKKNRDAERVSDIAALQLALSVYYSKNGGVYPATLDPNVLSAPADSFVDPGGASYEYVPLEKISSPSKCTFYHLGAILELPSAQVDSADSFDSTIVLGDIIKSGSYKYCGSYNGSGLTHNSLHYNVHP